MEILCFTLNETCISNSLVSRMSGVGVGAHSPFFTNTVSIIIIIGIFEFGFYYAVDSLEKLFQFFCVLRPINM